MLSLADGAIVEGELEPTSEVPMHLAIYRATATGAIAHTHAATSTAIGLVCEEIPLIHYTMLSLGGALRVAPYATYGTDALAEHVVAALHYKQAALMRNHGSIAIGGTVAKAVDNLELAEWCAETYARALAAQRRAARPRRDAPAGAHPAGTGRRDQRRARLRLRHHQENPQVSALH